MNTASNENTELLPKTTLKYTGSKEAVAQFVADILLSSELNSASITIITRGKFADCSVLIAIDTSLVGIVVTKAQNYSARLIHISSENTPVG